MRRVAFRKRLMNLQTRKGGIQNEQIQKLYEQPFSFL